MYDVDILIVTYRAAEAAERCLKSVLNATLQSDLSYRVTVLDNASGDGTAERLNSAFPTVEVVARRTNGGFGLACNEGVNRTSGDYILMLNPDTEITPGVIEHMVEVLRIHSEVGIAGPRLVRLDGSIDHAAKRNSPGPRAALRYMVGKQLGADWTSDYLAPDVDEYAFGYVDAINGAFMIMRRKDLTSVGLFDERYWMYGEDLDLCRRFRRNGLKVAYDGRVTAVHLKGASSGQHRSMRVNWHFHRSMWIYFRDESPAPGRFVSALVAAGILAHWAFTSLRGILALAKSQAMQHNLTISSGTHGA
ncbi:glycosyltransferase family 2 protein [Nocardioides terrisoli]|uniref:glycosyltransferase family 2 protein n=1 Tax=Nocardioides terrisoli TaxID=3388267 RepID=UPI00287B8ADE|nr:glycosyltransferase family 2 protein [Nocardioides marmorisolisilvae]